LKAQEISEQHRMPPCPKAAAHVIIYGHVQGVGFRSWVWRTATALGLVGWVRNRRDGSVEALFEGAPALVDDMVAKCEKGPPYASVTRVEVLQDQFKAPNASFDVFPTV
jgi:acylphosphatase